MSDRPLVSIITPTWQRHTLLAETIVHVREQDYPNLEHIMVTDGPDTSFEYLEIQCRAMRSGRSTTRAIPMAGGGAAHMGVPIDPVVRFAELGRNFSGEWPESFGVAPLTVGMLMARGEYIANLSDDDRMAPDYISRLVALLEETGADFAYSKCRYYWNGQTPEQGYDIGTDPPQHGQITAVVFRRELLRKAMPAWGSHPCDIALVNAWMAAGARWAFLPEVLFWHRADR